MVHVTAFTNKFFVEFIFSTDKVFYNTIHPGRVLVITSDGFIRSTKFVTKFIIFELLSPDHYLHVFSQSRMSIALLI